MIYNTDEDCFNFYSRNSAEWISICGALGQAVFTFEVTDIEVPRTYIVGKTIDPTSSFSQIKVTVTKPVAYDIGAVSNNRYTFNENRQFLYTIMAQEIAQPINTGTNQLKISNNGATLGYTYNLTILLDAATYSINCDNSIVNSVYEMDNNLNSSNTIHL